MFIFSSTVVYCRCNSVIDCNENLIKSIIIIIIIIIVVVVVVVVVVIVVVGYSIMIQTSFPAF